MRHVVLTRSAYGPAWDLAANARRLAVTRAVSAPLMAAQTARDWTWVVLLDARDPLLADRLALYERSAPSFRPIVWTPPAVPEHDHLVRQRIAAADYKAPWRAALDSGEPLMMTRIDDDDGFAPDALARYQAAAAKVRSRAVLMLPSGVRVWAGRSADVTHKSNAMASLVTMPGDDLCIYDYSHVKVRDKVPDVRMIDQSWGWLWVRHRDTISNWRLADQPISRTIRQAFPIDWPALEAAWRAS